MFGRVWDVEVLVGNFCKTGMGTRIIIRVGMSDVMLIGMLLISCSCLAVRIFGA